MNKIETLIKELKELVVWMNEEQLNEVILIAHSELMTIEHSQSADDIFPVDIIDNDLYAKN